jgi:hypothetical protein
MKRYNVRDEPEDTEGPRLSYAILRARGTAVGAFLLLQQAPIAKMLLVLLFTRLFPVTFPRECFLDALPLSGLQVEGVTLYFLDDVLLLHLPLKTTQCILERLAFLHTNLCQ